MKNTEDKMLKKIKLICLIAGILTFVITVIIAHFWRPFSYAESGVMILIIFSFILTALLLQTIQNREKNKPKSIYIGKIVVVVIAYIDMLFEIIPRIF